MPEGAAPGARGTGGASTGARLDIGGGIIRGGGGAISGLVVMLGIAFVKDGALDVGGEVLGGGGLLGGLTLKALSSSPTYDGINTSPGALEGLPLSRLGAAEGGVRDGAGGAPKSEDLERRASANSCHCCSAFGGTGK